MSILKAVVIANDKKMFEALTHSGARTAIYIAGRYPLSNLIEIMENLMENISPPMRVSRRTLQEIFRRTCNRTSAVDNPHELDNLHLDKKRKIYCGRKQFRDILEMGNRGSRVITKASQLPDGGA